MPILTRKDNKQFISQPYRELLTYKSFNSLRKEVGLLAKSNGYFVRLFKRPSNQFEAVFSRDAGFLLGESIWQRFGQSEDLIFCEELDDKKHALLVIVRGSSVLLDAQILLENLNEELNSLTTAKTQFAVYVYGNIPAFDPANSTSKNKFSFDPDLIQSYTKLESPVFENLETDPALQLLPLESAISEHQIKSPVTTLTTLAIFFLLFFGFLIWHNQNQTSTSSQNAPDIFQGFFAALSTPSPTDQIVNYADDVTTLYTMPGWVATKANYVNNQATFEVHSIGGTLESLFIWANYHNAQVDLTTQGAQVTLVNSLKSRAQPKTIASDKLVSAWIIDQMMRLLPGKPIEITNISTNPGFKETDLSVNVSNISPNVLALIGKALDGLPVQFNGSAATIENGLLSGSIKLKVLGS